MFMSETADGVVTLNAAILSGTGSRLAFLGDVSITSVQDDQFLRYNAGTALWINQFITAADVGPGTFKIGAFTFNGLVSGTYFNGSFTASAPSILSQPVVIIDPSWNNLGAHFIFINSGNPVDQKIWFVSQDLGGSLRIVPAIDSASPGSFVDFCRVGGTGIRARWSANLDFNTDNAYDIGFSQFIGVVSGTQTTTTLQDLTQNWVTNAFVGLTVTAAQQKTILSNTSNTLTIVGSWTTPTNGTLYSIKAARPRDLNLSRNLVVSGTTTLIGIPKQQIGTSRTFASWPSTLFQLDTTKTTTSQTEGSFATYSLKANSLNANQQVVKISAIYNAAGDSPGAFNIKVGSFLIASGTLVVNQEALVEVLLYRLTSSTERAFTKTVSYLVSGTTVFSHRSMSDTKVFAPAADLTIDNVIDFRGNLTSGTSAMTLYVANITLEAD